MKVRVFLVYLFFTGIACSFSNQATAQLFFLRKTRLRYKNIALDTAKNALIFTYDLKASKRRYFRINLFYSANKGKSYKPPLRSLTGNRDSVKAGKNKKLVWSFYKDNPYFDGQNIVYKIEATELPKIAKGGAVNALRSLALPGWGDANVRNGYHYEWVAVLTYSLLGAGYYFYAQTRRLYDDYNANKPKNQDDFDALFTKVEANNNLSRGFFAAGAVVWLADIAGVYLRGSKNKKRFARKKKPKGEKLSFLQPSQKFRPQIYLLPTVHPRFGNGQVSLFCRF